MSIASSGSLAIAVRAVMSSSRSRSAIRFAGTASTCSSRARPFSTRARPNGIGVRASVCRPTAGMSSWNVAKPCRWSVSAPFCLPRPMAIIFIKPLSISPSKSVCGLTRLTGMIRSASSKACRSTNTGTPGATSPRSTVSIEERISQPIASGVIPYAARTSTCPWAVAPPWLPIAGTMKTDAPASWRRSTTARTTWSIRSIPRLPAATQARAPGATVPITGSRAARTAALTSPTSAGSRAWRTTAHSASVPRSNSANGG